MDSIRLRRDQCRVDRRVLAWPQEEVVEAAERVRR